MKTVTVVSAFVPLNVKHMKAEQYSALGAQMFDAAVAGGANKVFWDEFPIERCWSNTLCRHLPPATATPADRYETPEDHVRSHIVQHTRTQWALAALEMFPDTEMIVWLDLGILKQGHWNNHPVTPEHVSAFVDAVARYEGDDIPFPGIGGPGPINPFGDNWRFCGSTHLWPVKHLPQIHRSYKANLINFIEMYKKIPLDLAIWPLVEQNSGLPYRWYQAEYDCTQLTGFPCTN